LELSFPGVLPSPEELSFPGVLPSPEELSFPGVLPSPEELSFPGLLPFSEPLCFPGALSFPPVPLLPLPMSLSLSLPAPGAPLPLPFLLPSWVSSPVPDPLPGPSAVSLPFPVSDGDGPGDVPPPEGGPAASPVSTIGLNTPTTLAATRIPTIPATARMSAVVSTCARIGRNNARWRIKVLLEMNRRKRLSEVERIVSDRDPAPAGEFLVDVLDESGPPEAVLDRFAVDRHGPDEWVLSVRRPS
jgi:hypothetical protein